MSYLVLARKWRPQTFAAVVGQQHITETLRKAVEKGRLAHAYLFAGPRGCGKTTTARLLAKVINCERPHDAEPCNECASCRAVIEGKHLDVIEIDGASNRGIDEIRDLREKLSYAPAQGKCKVYIIDEVHMLTPQAFNALLKTLEEPPAHVYLVFATTEPHKVPPTILSRCQRFNFKRLELREILGQLEQIVAAEKIACDREALILIARRAEGSMRDGESLLDQCIAAVEGRLDLALVRRVLGLVDSQLTIELLRAVAARDRGAALGIVDRAVAAGIDLEEFFIAYLEGLRNLLVLGVGAGDAGEWLDLTAGEVEELRIIGRELCVENILFLFRSALRAYRDLKGGAEPRYIVEAAVAEAASWESAVELSDLIKRLEGADGSSSSRKAGGVPGGSRDETPAGPAKTKEPAAGTRRAQRPGGTIVEARSTPPASSSPGDDDDAGESIAEEGADLPEGAFATVDRSAGIDRSMPSAVAAGDAEEAYRDLGGREGWGRFLAQIRESKLTLGIWLMSAGIKGTRGDRLILAFSPQNRFAREMILEEKNRRYIEGHLERFYGKRLRIETDDAPAASAPAAAEPPPDERSGNVRKPLDGELERLAEKGPVLRRLIEEMDGELYNERS